MADERPLLFFDSGVGGLSVLAAVRDLLPRAPIVYAADSAGFPYGPKSEGEIAARVPALLGRLAERYRPRLIVVACNTASTIALPAMRAALDLPIVGTVPAIKPAAAISQSRVIGVLGTQATVRQRYVDNLSAEFAGDCLVLRHGSPVLVQLAEDSLRGKPTDPALYAQEMDALFDQPGGEAMDTVVLACTHFPLVQAELAAGARRPVAFVDGGAGIARRVDYLTQGQEWPDAPAPGIAVFTALNPSIETLAPGLARYGLDRIEGL